MNASFLYHFIGDLQEDETMPAVVLYEHDERGLQYLAIEKVYVRDGKLVLESGRWLGPPSPAGGDGHGG